MNARHFSLCIITHDICKQCDSFGFRYKIHGCLREWELVLRSHFSLGFRRILHSITWRADGMRRTGASQNCGDSQHWTVSTKQPAEQSDEQSAKQSARKVNTEQSARTVIQNCPHRTVWRTVSTEQSAQNSHHRTVNHYYQHRTVSQNSQLRTVSQSQARTSWVLTGSVRRIAGLAQQATGRQSLLDGPERGSGGSGKGPAWPRGKTAGSEGRDPSSSPARLLDVGLAAECLSIWREAKNRQNR